MGATSPPRPPLRGEKGEMTAPITHHIGSEGARCIVPLPARRPVSRRVIRVVGPARRVINELLLNALQILWRANNVFVVIALPHDHVLATRQLMDPTRHGGFVQADQRGQ